MSEDAIKNKVPTNFEIYNEISNRVSKISSLTRSLLFDDILESLNKDQASCLWVMSDLLNELERFILKFCLSNFGVQP